MYQKNDLVWIKLFKPVQHEVNIVARCEVTAISGPEGK